MVGGGGGGGVSERPGETRSEICLGRDISFPHLVNLSSYNTRLILPTPPIRVLTNLTSSPSVETAVILISNLVPWSHFPFPSFLSYPDLKKICHFPSCLWDKHNSHLKTEQQETRYASSLRCPQNMFKLETIWREYFPIINTLMRF